MDKIWKHTLLLAMTLLCGVLLRVYILLSNGISHEMGIDSFFYHTEANVLMKYHTYTWWLHPLSFWGLYPYSDSPGAPTLIAEMATLSGLPVEQTIFLFDVLCMIFGGLSMYILMLKIRRDFLVPPLSTYLFIIAPILLLRSIWSIGEREFLVFSIPLLALFGIYLLNSKHVLRTTFLMGIYIFAISTVHLTFIFLYGFIFALIIIKIYQHLSFIRELFKKINMNRIIRGIIYIAISLIALYSLFIVNNFVTLPVRFSIKQYQESALFQGTDPLTILINIGVSASGGVGVLFPIFFPIGYLYIVFAKRMPPYQKYFYWTMVISLPIIINRLYSRPVIVFFGVIFISLGIQWFLNKISFKVDRKKLIKSLHVLIIVSLLLSSTFFSVWYVNYQFEKKGDMAIHYPPGASQSTYEMGIYQKYCVDKIWIGNDWVTAQRIQAYSNVPMQPSICGSPLLSNPVLYSLVNESELGIKKSEKMFLYTARWYFSTYMSMESRDYGKFFTSESGSQTAEQIIYKYDIFYVCEYKIINGKFAGYYTHGIYNSKFLQTAKTRNYKIFSNDLFNIYLL